MPGRPFRLVTRHPPKLLNQLADNTLHHHASSVEGTPERGVGGGSRLVSLLTDFGTADHYVGVMKAVVLARAPGVALVDLSQEVPPGSVAQGAFLLLAAYPYFPPESVHIAVVDPGVGSERRALVVVCGRQYFVGPDNGIFSYLLEREPEARIYHVTNERFTTALASTTFHGRDLFAPVGAALAAGTPPEALGTRIEDPVRIPSLATSTEPDGTLTGRILHIDRFGNCITSFTRADLPPGESPFRLEFSGTRLDELRSHYAGAPDEEPFLVWGSSGFLEISVNRGSAASRLGIEIGNAVHLIISG